MPIYEPDHVEYSITSGNIQIAMDDGRKLPAYWAHPTLGNRFPGIAVIHDWWGITPIIRRMANLFAQMGHYVIAPDLFNGQTAQTAQEAMRLVESLSDRGYQLVDDALTVLEDHHHCNESVAAVGIGMGGSLAFEAAIKRDDLEAAVAYGGFPHNYLGKIKDANTPICAFFGENEPYIKAEIIEKLKAEMTQSRFNLPHEIHIIPEMGHEFFTDKLTQKQREHSRQVLKETLRFLDQHLEPPKKRNPSSI
ncbi:MAG: hypothetical protein Kow00117_22910 [Phototrophicales bacterium]